MTITDREFDALRTLTTREHEVLRFICGGMSNPQIAAQLFVSPNTVRFHVKNILRKLEVGSRVEAAVLATAHSAA